MDELQGAANPVPSTLADGRRNFALEVIRHLQSCGYQAFLVGGCVRDRLLGFTPKDYDVSTDATPAQVLELFADAALVGAHFGVVLLHQSPDLYIEVATFRSEGEYSDGRRPDAVQFEKNPAQDARRRDFTINGLFEDPLSGRVYDFVGGLADLEARRIRAIGEPARRFAEDHLRLLRAVRFAARLGFSIDNPTLLAMRELAPRVRSVSAERVRDELVRILMEGGARYGFELLSATGLLDHTLPDVKAFQGVMQPPQYHPEGDVWTHVLMMLDNMHQPSRTLAWGVLLHDVGKPSTFRIADRIRFDGHAEVGARITQRILSDLRVSGDDTEQATALVANHMRFKDVRQMRLSTLKRFLRLPSFDEHLELHRLDCAASNGRTDAYDYVRSMLLTLQEEQLTPPRLLTGKDLIAAGFKPGPDFKSALDAVETAQLEGEIQTSEQALRIASAVLVNGQNS